MEESISKKINILLQDAKKIVNSSPDESYTKCRTAYDLAKENSLNLDLGYALLGMAFVHRSRSDSAKMLEVLFTAQDIFEEEKDVLGLVRAYNLIGVAYFYSSMYDKAISYFLKANEYLNEEEDYNLRLSVINNIGEVYRESQNYSKALEFYDDAIKICDMTKNRTSKAVINGNIGEIHFIEKNYEKALEYFIESHDELQNENDNISLGEVENRIGKIHQVLGNLSLASEYFNSAYDRLERIDNKYFVVDVLLNIGQLNIEDVSSLKYFEKACKYSENINAKKKLWESLLGLSDYYEVHENYKQALEVYKRHCRLDKEIVAANLGKKLEILNVELKYLEETKHLERMKELLTTELDNQKKELDRIRSINIDLEKKAYEDELTKVPNRRRVNLHINDIISNSSSDKNICVFIIDIDFFKRYNDYWGHNEGDICLKTIADLIMDNKYNKDDLFGRYGGEEFVYVSEAISKDEVEDFGNMIREKVKKLDLYYYYRNTRTSITISLGGIFGSTREYNSIKTIMTNADEELYKAKENGRDKVYVKLK